MEKKFLLLIISIFQVFLMHAKVVLITDKTTEKEINERLVELQANDTLLLQGGYYKKNFKLKNIHGKPDYPIVIRGVKKGLVTIDGGASEPGSSLSNYGFLLTDCSWIIIDNLLFKDCWTDAIRIENSSYVSLTNSTILGSRRAVYASGRRSHHFLIENCYWEQGEHVWTKEGEYSWEELHHGEFRYYNGSIFQTNRISGSFIIRNNYIKNVYNGIRLSIMGEAEQDTLACTNGEIYNNIIENSADNAFEPEVYCKNLHFYHNKMINSHAFISLTEVGGGPLYIYGNTGVKLPDCKDGWTIFKIVGEERRLTKPLYIFNNSWQVDSDIWGRQAETYWNCDNVYHFNNAYYISKKDTVGIYYLGANNVFENDCANIPFPKIVTETGTHQSITADPLFIDGAHGNFLLRENSPCLNKGLIPSNIKIGFTGEKLDIGAYDDGILVEGPPFRYENPGIEMPDKEKPRIVRHKVEGNFLKLWFSVPINPSTVSTKSFMLNADTASYSFVECNLQDEEYLLILKSAQTLPSKNISLSVKQKPIGKNGEEMVLWASTIPSKQITEDERALNITREIADRLLKNVSFSFIPQTVTFNAHVAHLNVDCRDLKTNEVACGLININTDIEKNAILGFSFHGNISIILNESTIYSGKSENNNFQEYAYNRFHFKNQIRVHLQKGENELKVKGLGIDAVLSFACCIQKENGMFDDQVMIKNNINNSYINNWLIAAPYKDSCALNTWHLQAPMLQQCFYLPTGTNKKEFTADWNYANSNTLLGILNLYKATGDYRYKRFVEMYNKQLIDNYHFFKEQYFTQHILRGTYFRLFRSAMLDDTSGSALSLTEIATIDKPKGLQKKIIDEMLDYVLNKQLRLPDGTFCRAEPIKNTVWADDLFMSVAFLLRMAEITSNSHLYDEVAHQIIQFNKYLTDKETGLYKHGWYAQNQKQSSVAWARANGWIIWATSEALLKMPSSHKDYHKIRTLFIEHLETIFSYQAQSGLWHQVLTCPDSYLETSSSAMFALSLARAIRKEWLPLSYSQQLMKAWKAIVNKMDCDGSVNGICSGTDMSEDVSYYMNQKTVVNDPRGMGAILTLGTEMNKFFIYSQNK